MIIILNELKTKLLQKLYIIEQQPGIALFKWKESANISAAVIIELKNEMKEHPFETERQEIIFYKETFPWFYSQAIYYHHLFHIEARIATNGNNGSRKFLKKELFSIYRFFKAHHQLHLYMKMGETNRDEQYFLRKNQNALYSNAIFMTDNGCTEHVYKLAKIIALERVKEQLEIKLHELEKYPVQWKVQQKGKPPLKWTASKSDLIELLYALHSSRVFNDGKDVDVRQIANWLETTLHLDLGNYYRVFQSMRIRKKNRRKFLDTLRESLIHRMDQADEHPRN